MARYGHTDEKAMLFPTHSIATRCIDFFLSRDPSVPRDQLRLVEFVPNPQRTQPDGTQRVLPKLSAVLYPKEHWPIAKSYWQHTGDGVSSRRAEFCEKALLEGSLVEKNSIAEVPRMKKGPRRYQRQVSIDESNGSTDGQDFSSFVEERFGRNMSVAFARNAKLAVRRRITGSLSSDADLHEALEHPEDWEKTRSVDDFSVDDVYLYPTGMSAIFNMHRTMRLARGEMKSIMYG